MANEDATSYSTVNDRLKEIAEQVSDDSLPLDDALDLFEEAVKLGMQASTLLEQDIAAQDDEDDEAGEDSSDEAVVEAKG